MIDIRNRKVFLEGAAGTGKTTTAIDTLRGLLDAGVKPERILVLVPQVTLGRPYQLAVHGSGSIGGTVDITTVSGIAKEALRTFWVLVSVPMGFAEPWKEPTFLNIETAQYYMARFANPAIEIGRFDGVAVTRPRIISQTLDNLNRAAIMRFPLDEVADRLVAAWGADRGGDKERHSSRIPVYQTAIELAKEFREYCLQNNLLDYSLVIEAFNGFLQNDPRFSRAFLGKYDYLIADNIEEDSPAGHDFIRWLLPHLKGALLIYDTEGSYRLFLGADAESAYTLRGLCNDTITDPNYVAPSPTMQALTRAFDSSIISPNYVPMVAETDVDAQNDRSTEEESDQDGRAIAYPYKDADGEEGTHTQSSVLSPQSLSAFDYTFDRYYPQMLNTVADRVIDLVKNQGVSPREIAILSTYLSDSLRFTLTYRFEQAGIPVVSHRPSRALQDEPVTRALLTLAALSNPAWVESMPPMIDVADTFAAVIEDMDRVRARRLAGIVYSTGRTLTSFGLIEPKMQSRITFTLGERYEALRDWLARYPEMNGGEFGALDHFLSRLFGELLTQKGFRYHNDLEAGRIAAQVIESAQRFRRTLYTDEGADLNAAGREYVGLIRQRLLSALHLQSWNDEETDAVLMMPAFTFLMRNRFVQHQFWLDIGAPAWGERLEQPLTHPYVLRRGFPRGEYWSDELEDDTQRELLYRILMGLTRRCKEKIHLAIADLGESGFEQRGTLLRVFQQILRMNEGNTNGA
jgi:hypothetical protein